MAANQITYSDKEQYQASALPDEQKWTSEDANEVKEAINNHASLIDPVTVNPGDLTDGAAITLDFESKILNNKNLTTTTTAITLTLDNVVRGSNMILSVIKNTASNVTITLAGTGLSFYGYNDANYAVTPDVILIGASGDKFDISFYARTETSIGVVIGVRGN